MNMLRWLWSDRRKSSLPVESDRRAGGAIKRYRAAADRLDAAVEKLQQTAKATEVHLPSLISREKMRLRQINRTVRFETFAAICEWRSQPNGTLMTTCKHPLHEAAGTGVAQCEASLCPKFKDR